MTIDTQVKFLDEKSLRSLGVWLCRKWFQCQAKKATAEAELLLLHLDEDMLRREWAAQVKAQTKPSPRRSKNKGKQAVEEIFSLQKALDISQVEKEELETGLMGDWVNEGHDVTELALQLESARNKVHNLETALRKKKEVLGVDDKANLKKLMNNAYLRVRMNALALKTRIRDRLRQRKFELERMERSYRNSINERKLHSHTETQIKRREPAITQLTKSYNDLCGQMENLVKAKKAPINAVVAERIPKDGLFKLDVDDSIWQDIGLEENVGVMPAWLSDGKVRDGIKAMLELDRCKEEEVRLKRERCALQEWFLEEWGCVQLAIRSAQSDEDPDLVYQLELHLKYLLRLCAGYQPSLRSIPCALQTSWGPSQKDLADTLSAEYHSGWDTAHSVADATVVEEDEVDRSENEEWGEIENEDDDDLLEAVEALALANAYQDGEDKIYEVWRGRSQYTDQSVYKRSNSVSPRKRSRREDDI
jgi:hypothetical protein